MTESANCVWRDVPGISGAKALAKGIDQLLSPISNFAIEASRSIVSTDEIFLNSWMGIFYYMYTLRGDDEITKFLGDNKFLAPIVAEAYGKLQNHFPDSTIFMEVIGDELVISVGTTLSPKEAKETLYRFDEEWWLDNCTNTQSKLCITVEFQ